MSEHRFTPGPWMAFAHPSYGFCIYPTGDGAQPVRDSFAVVNFADASRGYGSEEAKANARLIAAAPDLLEALKRLLPHTDWLEDEGPIGTGWKSDELVSVIQNARAAIAKATGELP